MARLRLITDSTVVDPVLDAGISRALMLRVAAGELPDTLRISRPGPCVAFGKRDVIAAGYAAGVRAARGAGFEAVERLAGGRAAVFHEQTVHFSRSVADPDPRSAVTRRFADTAALVAEALRGLGVDAHVGEVEGEYCPGAHSVNAGGRTKLMGVGQRVVRGGANVGGVIAVDGAERIRDVLIPVYSALGLEWRPETAGSVSDEIGEASWDRVTDALIAGYAGHHEIEPARLDDVTLQLAAALAPEHVPA